MASNQVILYQNTTMALTMKRLKNKLTDQLVTTDDFGSAAVSFRVLDSTGTIVTGTSDPIACTEVAGKNGSWRGLIPSTASLSLGNRGTIVVTSTDGTNSDERTIPYVVKENKG